MNRKTLVLLLVALVLMAGGLFATDSRMTALGYPYGFIRDNTDVHTYPATIFKYNRTLTGELHSGYYYDGYDGNMEWNIGTNVPMKSNVLGLYFNLPTDIFVNDHMYFPYGGYGAKEIDLDISKKIQFYFGFMEKFAVGFGMAMDSDKYEWTEGDEDGKYEASASYFELSGGMSTDKLDTGLIFHLAGASGEDMDYYDEASFAEIGVQLSGRYFIKEGGGLDLTAASNLMFISGGDEWQLDISKETATVNRDYSVMAFDLGGGAKYTPGANHNIILTVKPLRFITMNYDLTNSESDTQESYGSTYLVVPEYTLGLESRINNWLTGRIGAIQQFIFWSNKDEMEYDDDWETPDWTDDYSGYENSFDMNLGLAFKFGKFTIDAVLEKDLLHAGPNFIGGASTGLASQVSVYFEF